MTFEKEVSFQEIENDLLSICSALGGGDTTLETSEENDLNNPALIETNYLLGDECLGI